MKHLLSAYLSISILACATLHAESQALKITNPLGWHTLADNVFVEVYANTKGELWYSVYFGKESKGGSIISNTTGSNTAFWWDSAKKQLWVISDKFASLNDYSKPNSTSSQGVNIASIATMNPPQEVLDIVSTFLPK